MTLAEAHIEAQRRLRDFAENAVGTIWARLPGYDEEHVEPFVKSVVPIVLAAQRQSVSVTDAFLARALGRSPLGVPREEASGAAVRAGTPPEHVYRRPFVTVWTALQAGTEWEAAVASGLARARSTAATDVQLSMRQAAHLVGEQDDNIYGFARKANPGACKFCQTVDGAYVKSASAFPLHPHCGCGLEPLTEPHPLAATLPDGVAVREHGELGPVLTDPVHEFTSEVDLA